MGRYDDVVVVIPALRGFDTLAALLTSLTPEIDGSDVLVLVANHQDPAIPRRVAHLSATVGVQALSFTVPEPGVAVTRNALFRAATSERPGWRWIVMLDAPVLSPGWLATLLELGDRDDADVVVGPSGDGNAGTAELGSARAIAISRRIGDALGDSWFVPAQGDPDAAFFRAVTDLGGVVRAVQLGA